MTGRHAARDQAPGRLLVAGGTVLFVAGVVAVVASVVPFLLSGTEGPFPATLLAGVLLPLGLAVALIGLLRGARTRRRTARRQRS